MGAPAVLPAMVVFPSGVTHLASGGVARLFGVLPRAVGQWERDGLLTASVRTGGGHRRFTQADLEAFIHETCPAGQLVAGDIVSRRGWNGGEPIRITAVILAPRWGVCLRWQDVAAHHHAVEVRAGRNKLVRRLHHREHLGAA
ncbi:MerR family DNA-binding transcriptional regulator [Streptosporangium sp. NPDC051023]|uniref:MerR family transcriptional regulator n=1 Tax=Streptosporangium sp. NPDC051023 TaxID=3155410 RepID=UPI003450D0EA